MADMKAGRTVAALVAALALIGIGVAGGHSAISEWNQPETPLQRAVSVGSIIYAALGIITGIAVLARREWSFSAALVWTAVVTFVGTSAVIAYDTEASALGAVAAGVLCIVIGGIIAWLARIGTRKKREMVREPVSSK